MTDEKPVYTEADIRKLNPMEHVRLRPGMYIGGTDKNALHHLFHEILDEAIYEAKAGYCDHIWITLRPNYELLIRDNGRGMQVESTQYGKKTLELLMTQVFVGYYRPPYTVSGGLHGVGVTAVNALCAECTAQVARDGYLWRQTYREGIPHTEVIQVRPLADDEPTGTQITIRPDFTIFEPNDFDYAILADRAREVAYLLPDLTITLRDERQKDVREDVYHFAGGISDYVTYLNQPYSVLHSPLDARSECTISPKNRQPYTIRVEVALQYADTPDSKIVGCVNTVKTMGGYHTDSFVSTLTRIVNQGVSSSKLEPFSTDEVLSGLTAIVSVWHPLPSYESQTRITFIQSNIRGIVMATVEAATRNNYELQPIIQKFLANREALKKQ
jgi:DNA gyrase subunit B